MLCKSSVMSAAVALGLSLLGGPASSAGENSAAALPGNTQTSAFVLVRHGGGGGGHWGGGHWGGHHSFNHGFRNHRFFFAHHRFHHRRFFFAGPVFYGDYDGGSCYWNCRQSHGPGYCRLYADNYC